MRTKIVTGNWKMNTSVIQGVALSTSIVEQMECIPKGITVVVAPPFTHLYPIYQKIAGTPIKLGAQNCAAFGGGAYTGEVSAAMLASAGCQFVILGHSERREYYKEDSWVLTQKLNQALQAGLTPIFCVGERLEERENNLHFKVITSQLQETVATLTPSDFSKIVIAYEPVWAIGTGKTATSEQAQEVHAFIRTILSETFGASAAQTSILYGGSCKPSNAAELFAQPDIDGGLIGGASLLAQDFLSIAKAF